MEELPDNLRPIGFRRAQARWSAPCEPEATVPVPEGLPPCGTAPGGHNAAARWLQRRGWWSMSDVAVLYNVEKRWLKTKAQNGRIPYLRVGYQSWWFDEGNVFDFFQALADPGMYFAWVEAGRPRRKPGGDYVG